MTDKNITTIGVATSAGLDSNFLVRLAGETEDKSLTGVRLMTMVRNLVYSIAGQGPVIKEGTNGRMGTATLVAGTVTVLNTSITASTRVVPFLITLGTVSRPAALGSTVRVAATSFTIQSGDVTDTSTIGWLLIEPAP